ncbi:hypothetical protein [Aliarcobacter butzleri]|uniref:hypothetical protein n=1 Tax=Aliarcobacter butzleri TaxID=28197 RepID=UPI003AF45E48
MKELTIENLKLKIECSRCKAEVIIPHEYNNDAIKCPCCHRILVNDTQNSTITFFSSLFNSIKRENEAGSKITIISNEE